MVLLAGLTLMALAVLALTRIRRQPGEEEQADGRALGATAVLIVSAFVVLFSAIATFGPAMEAFVEKFHSWLKPAVRGAIVGLAIYTGSVFVFDVCGRVFLWSRKESHAADETLRFWVRRHIYGGTAAMLFLTIFMVVVMRVGDNAAPWAVAFITAAIHLYYPWVMPWFLYLRSQRLDPDEFREVHQWLHEQTRRRKIPKFYLRVQAGGMINALASGGVYRHFIVLGQGLLDRLSIEHVKAILAHELGHVLNRDNTRRTLPVIGLCAILHAVYLQEIAFEQESAALRIGAFTVGMLVFWYLLPNYFGRRREFEADRRAVELIGDAEPVAQALEAFAEASETPLDHKGWTHPPMRARIEAIRKLGAKRNSDDPKSPT